MALIYSLNCPETNEVKYIGQTTQPLWKRLQDHLYDHKRNKRTNWIKSLLKRNLKPQINLIEEVSEEKLNEKEIYYIQYYTNLGIDLKNGTLGGAIKLTEESLEKMKNTMNSPEVLQKLRNCKLGDKNPSKRPEVRIKISEACKSRTIRPVLQLSLDGELIKEWKQQKEASIELGIHKDSIYAACKGKNKTGGGFKWMYKDLHPDFKA